MDKINFENLPSTKTPVSAENLNAMQSNIEKSVVAVGSTQPSTTEKVWIKKGKNLLNKNNLLPLFMPPNSTDEVLAYNANTFTTPWIKCSANMSYVISGGNRNRWQLKSNTGVITFIDRATITTNPDTEYFRCYCYAEGSLDNANIQIEQGSIATAYEPYVEKEILVKNNNGVFEEFFDESDIPNVDTSRWTQTLLGYRYTNGNNVVYAGTVVASFSSGSINFDITNLGLAERPDTVQLTANSLRYPLRYDYDSSTATRLKIEVINNGSVYTYTGNVRFSMTVYGKLA